MNFKYLSLITLTLWLTSCAMQTSEQIQASKEGKEQIKKQELEGGFVGPFPQIQRQPVQQSFAVEKFCKKIDRYFKKYNWGKSGCEFHHWNHVRSSYKGNPLIWKVYGNESQHRVEKKNMTMFMCGVHGDEITPIKFCFDLIDDLDKHPELIGKDNLVIVAPIVTPDSWMKKRPTRTNARGIDVNRNFPTRDWSAKALKLWRTRYKAAKRRYPGKRPLSEQETIFQVNLIKRYSPNKIISVHAPLTMLDYDGPIINRKETTEHGQNAKLLLETMSKKAQDYKVSDYPFFPGSLGNYAGNERNIPTYTLELPNSDWNKTDRYWKQFQNAIHYAIGHDMKAKRLTQSTTTTPLLEKTKN